MSTNRKRLTSLDAFRGIAIASMILVNNPGSWDAVYPPLLHAEWHGFTPTDLVFPAFLFIAGVAMAWSFAKYTHASNGDSEDQLSRRQLYWRIGRRCILLFVLGLFLNGFSGFLTTGAYDFSTIRIMGVLQRISLAYFLAAIVVLNVSRSRQWLVAIFLLLGYWLAMAFIPVPEFGAGDLSPTGNFAAYIDRGVIGTAHLYGHPPFEGQGDPEGLFSTLPAIVTVLLGYFTGEWLRHQPRRSRTSWRLVWAGIAGLAAGGLWHLVFPINKQLWTSPFVLFSAGWSLLLLALCYQLIEVKGKRHWGWPFEVMGLNAILVFVASGIVARILFKTHIGQGEDAPSTYTWLYETLFKSWAGATNGSLLFAIFTVLVWWLVAGIFYRKGWFLKV